MAGRASARSRVLIRLLLARVIAVDGGRRDAEAVLHRERHSAGRVILQLGERYEDVGLLISRVKIEGRKDRPAARNVESGIALRASQAIGVDELDVLSRTEQRLYIPARLEQILLHRSAS